MATLDDLSAAPDPHGESPPPGHAGELRRRAREILSAQRQQLDRLENDLPQELQRLAESVSQELAQDHAEQVARLQTGDTSPEVADLQAQVQQLRKQLAGGQGDSEQSRAELEQARREAKQFEQELRVTQSLLETSRAQGEQRRVEFAGLSEQLADAQAQVASAHSRQEELRHELAQERERTIVQEEETKAQRRRLARQFKDQRARQLAEIEERRQELQSSIASEDAQLVAQLTAARAEAVQGRARLSDLGKTLEQRTNELAQERRKADALKDQATQLRESLKKAHAERASEAEELARAAAEQTELLQQLVEQQSRCESLTAKLEEAEKKLTEGGKSDSGRKDDFARRLEMATDEVRELKRANAELEVKLASRRSGEPASSSGSAMSLNWEAQKQRLLASLEADDRDDDEAVAERQTIKETIRITTEAIAAKDLEIEDLKRLLATSVAPNVPDGAELTELFDKDELIRQERERLVQSQAEWREKIGQAEIAISVERAKLARDRMELEEKLRLLRDRDQSRPVDPSAPPENGGKPPRNRWLSKLGLRDLDEPT